MPGPKTRTVEVFFYILFVCMVLLLFYRFTSQNISRIQVRNTEYADDSAMQIAKRVADQFDSSLELVQTCAFFLGASLKKPEVTLRMLKEIEDRSPFDGVRFTDAEGISHSSGGEVIDARDRKYYREGMQGKSGLSVIMRSRFINKPVLGFFAPIYFEDKIIGVLHATYLSDKYLRSMLQTSYFGVPASVYLCEKNGEVIASSDDRNSGGNILRDLASEGVIDEKTALAAQEIFENGGNGSFICNEASSVDNICVMYLPEYPYVLVQTFPQSVTRRMIQQANTTGFELEASLLILFLAYAAWMLVRARIQKKNLEKKNRDLGLVIQGMNILYAGRYCIADLDTGKYTYLAGAKRSEDDLPSTGSYMDVIEHQREAMVEEANADEFMRLFEPANIRASLSSMPSITFMCHVDRDGDEEWENFIAICLEKRNGEPVKFLMVRQNVTDMKVRSLQAQKKISVLDRKEKQYQLALTTNAACSYQFNASRNLLEEDVQMKIDGSLISLVLFRGLRIPCKASDFLASWQPLILPESSEEYSTRANVDYLLEKFANGEKEVDLDFWYREPGGAEICMRQAFYMASDELGSDVMVMSVMRDITAHVKKQREQTRALQDALMLAQHANEAKTTFLSNMSHDIRTPMNAIIGFATIAASHLDNTAQVRDCLQKVLSSSNHLLSLINDILDMSRIESGKLQIKEQECNISELMHNLVNIIQPQIHAKQMQLFIDTFEVVNEDVITDPLKLNQVFINLLGNAVKYTPAGGIISFRLAQQPAFKHGWADYVFEVRDNGVGMAPEFVKHIFEPFTRESTTTQSGIQGTGLGMAITKNIIEMMNGKIEVESSPGKGSLFRVTLTLKLQDMDAEGESLENLRGVRALVVDDDYHVCDSVNRMLKKIGLRSEWTTSGREAVYRAQIARDDKDPYHTFIIDWQMPDMNGVETARKIRSIVGDDAPIIILTAYEWADIEEEAREAGVSAFCAKPLFMSDLKNALLSSHNLAAKVEEPPALGAEHFHNARILVVDDLEMNREIAEFILEESGFVVESAPDGTDAVEMVAKSPENWYGAILMDVQMPTMNGYEATRAIRNLEREDVKTMPIIAMTANALEEDKSAALKSGMNDHLAKPIQIKIFFEVLGKYFKKQS